MIYAVQMTKCGNTNGFEIVKSERDYVNIL